MYAPYSQGSSSLRWHGISPLSSSSFPEHDHEDDNGNEKDDADDSSHQPERDTSHARAPSMLVSHRLHNSGIVVCFCFQVNDVVAAETCPHRPVVLSFEDGVAACADLLHLRHILHGLQHLLRPHRPVQKVVVGVIEPQGGTDIWWCTVHGNVWHFYHI